MKKKITVIVVDDSALIRQLLSEIINSQPDMQAIGAAPDPLVAREMIRALNPDVLTLDVEMPKMDGLDFLERLMRLRPMPVVMVSSLTERGSDATLKALELGAVDFVSKPKIDIVQGIQAYAEEIADKIRTAAASRPRARSAAQRAPAGGARAARARQPQPVDGKADYRRRLHRRHRSDQGVPARHAAGLPRHSDHPAHARLVKQPVHISSMMGSNNRQVVRAGPAGAGLKDLIGRKRRYLSGRALN